MNSDYCSFPGKPKHTFHEFAQRWFQKGLEWLRKELLYSESF